MAATRTDGFVLVDKPPGLTSHDAVAMVRRRLGGARAGHTGTLDPAASGLLIVLTGAATRLARFVPGEPKVYEAAIVFGRETETDDAAGAIARTAPVPDESVVRAAIGTLTGAFLQVPPAYSAKQVGGRRAYAAARRGEAMALAAVPVTVSGWEVHSWSGDTLSVTITCSSGTYIRALARDLGRACASAAHLARLRRTQVGPFHVRDAVPPRNVDEALVRPALGALAGLPIVALDAAQESLVRHGRPVECDARPRTAAMVSASGRLVAVAESRDGSLLPRVVLADA